MFITLCKVLHPKTEGIRRLKKSNYMEEFARYRIIQLFESAPISKEMRNYLKDYILEIDENQFLILQYILDIDDSKIDGLDQLEEIQKDNIIILVSELDYFINDFTKEKINKKIMDDERYIILLD